MQIERQRVVALIDELLGCFVHLSTGEIAEVIGIADNDPTSIKIEWLSGDKFGECCLMDTQPTTHLPPHCVTYKENQK